MRLAGALLVIGASSFLGFMVADNYRQRPRILGRFAQATEMLRSQIAYGLVPLPRALDAVAALSNGAVAAVLSEAARHLASGEGLSGGEAWERAVTASPFLLPLTSDEMSMVLDIGRSLGSSDRVDQEKHLALAAENLRARAVQIEETAHRGARLWLYLGITGGSVIVLLLL